MEARILIYNLGLLIIIFSLILQLFGFVNGVFNLDYATANLNLQIFNISINIPAGAILIEFLKSLAVGVGASLTYIIVKGFITGTYPYTEMSTILWIIGVITFFNILTVPYNIITWLLNLGALGSIVAIILSIFYLIMYYSIISRYIL